MRVLLKIGGTLLDDAAARGRLARELAAVRSPGLELVVVHGGGKQMTRFLEEGGVASRFVNGLRVTTPEVVDALLKVFTGSVNKQLVASLVAAGVPAVGISGIDAILLEAEKLDEKLGAVGRPVRCNPELLTVLVEGGFLPVVACVAGDRAGRIFNVNADQMAVACASGFRADRLYFLTDVDGVRDASGTVILVERERRRDAHPRAGGHRRNASQAGLGPAGAAGRRPGSRHRPRRRTWSNRPTAGR